MVSAAYGLHCCTVVTALTAQNPRGVRAVMPASPEFVREQMDCVFEEYSVAALKTGMLGNGEIVRTVAEALAKKPHVKKVIDPVMVATSGARLLDESALDLLRNALLPLADIATPNIPEAEMLLGESIPADDAALAEAAEKLAATCRTKILLKGGHSRANRAQTREKERECTQCCDYLFDGTQTIRYNLDWLDNPVSTHGTGCSLAAALAAELALGRNLHDAVRGAKNAVWNAIRSGRRVGADCGVMGIPGMKHL